MNTLFSGITACHSGSDARDLTVFKQWPTRVTRRNRDLVETPSELRENVISIRREKAADGIISEALVTRALRKLFLTVTNEENRVARLDYIRVHTEVIFEGILGKYHKSKVKSAVTLLAMSWVGRVYIYFL